MRNSVDLMPGRRGLAKSALLGSAALLLGGQASAQTGAQSEGGEAAMNVRKFGAIGDGKTDDTKAMQRALDAAGAVQGAVIVPPGVYLAVDLRVPPNTALMGNPTWDFRGPGGTVLRLATGDAKCLLNITEAKGTTIDGLAIDGADLGKGVHGILMDKPDKGKHETPCVLNAAGSRTSQATGCILAMPGPLPCGTRCWHSTNGTA
jgi:Pectate lyase superfamily protein